jgi:2-polyprenyl-3-methyl-5-hydroxy-6-metoxy-1,4-benzoquinol methylase
MYLLNGLVIKTRASNYKMTAPIQNKTDVNIFHEIAGESSKNGFGAEEDTTISYPELAARSRDNLSFRNYEQLLTHIVEAYDSRVIRVYSKVRFAIININILHILALCLRGKRRILDVGCGFGLFGCYFSALYPEISYCGLDLDSKRINMANQAAKRLDLNNATFYRGMHAS